MDPGAELGATDELAAALGCESAALSELEPHAVMLIVDNPMTAPSAVAFNSVFMLIGITADRYKFDR